MTKKLIISSLINIVFLATAYAVSEKNVVSTNLCSTEWYSLVEKQILTGDGKGHGPDPGSTEWRSVVEFKLGIRNDPRVPPLDTDQWCDYIDRIYIRQSK